MKNCTIIHGDRLKLLSKFKDKSVQLIVTSPPYNIGRSYEIKKPLDEYLEDQKKR